MRNKIFVILIAGYPKVSDLIDEKGYFHVLRLSEQEINFLFESNFFYTISNEFDLYWIDHSEHEIICEDFKLIGIKKISEDFKAKFSDYEYLFEAIIEALDIAIIKKTCFAIIL